MAEGAKTFKAPLKSTLVLGFFALALGLFATLAACTPMVPLETPSGIYRIKAEPADFDQLISTAEVVCENKDPQSCPEFAGMIAIKGKVDGVFGIGQCSAFLFNEDHVITNSHCLPPELRKAGASCSGQIRMIFPESGHHPRESAACRRVVWASEIANAGQSNFAEKPDVAILKLNRKVKRQGTSFSRQGIPDGTKLTVYAVDPNSVISIRGILRAKECTSVQKNWLLPSYQNDFHRVATFTGCEIKHGNSGSPAIDKNGFVRAITHASIASATYEAGPLEGNKRASRTFNSISLMTNAACIEVPEKTGLRISVIEVNPSCDNSEDPVKAREDIEAALYHSSFVDLFAKWRNSLAPKELNFKLVRSGVDQFGRPLASPSIECVNEEKLIGSPVAPEGTLLIRYTQPLWALEYDFDPDYRRLGREIALSFDEIQFEFSVHELLKKGRVNATLKRGAFTSVELTYPIGLCF